MIFRILRLVVFLPLVAAALASCIDEDLSKCGPGETDLEIYYVIDLDEDDESAFGEQTLYALHAGFWTDTTALYAEQHYAREEFPPGLVFRFTLPRDRYSHIVTANESDAGAETSFPEDESNLVICRPEIAADTIAAMQSPIFVGRGTIDNDTCNCETHTYVVPLRPVVSRMEITVAHSTEVSGMRAVVSGTFAGYRAMDAEFVADTTLRTKVDAETVVAVVDTVSQMDFYSFPTAVRPEPAAVVQSAAATNDGKWQIRFFAERDGKTIMNSYTIDEPVYAGEVFRRRFKFYDDEQSATDAGVEVDLDWKPGGDHNEEI